MWGDASATYGSLRTNVSRFTNCFSDFPWPASSPDFPSPSDVSKYLAAYKKAFLSNCNFALSCEVLQVRPFAPTAPWLVEWREADANGRASATRSQHFDFVIVASGYSATPHRPLLPGLEGFTGLVLHSSEYCGPSSIAGRRKVVVLGSGHSAVDIAADLAASSLTNATVPAAAAPPSHPDSQLPGQASQTRPAAAAAESPAVVHVLHKPFWVVPRYLPTEPASPAPAFLPLDLQLYRRSGRSAGGRERLFPTPEQHQRANAYWHSMCGDQGARLHPCLAISPDSREPPVVAISDTYGPLAAAGRMQLRRGRLLRVTGGSSLELSDCGPSLTDVDAVVLCTGFRPDMSFLPLEVLDTLSYTPDDNYVPLALHRGVFHPDVPGLAFVGTFRGPYFGTVELQARLAAATFSGAVPLEPEAAQREGVAAELALRAQAPRPALPHGDYVGHAESLAAALGALPPAEWRATHDVVVPGDFAAFPPDWSESGQHPAASHAEASAVAEPSPAGEPSSPRVAAAAAARLAMAAAASAEAARQSVAETEAALAGYLRGRMVPRAVFHALHGEWVMRRRIVSRLASSPSGLVTGTASFAAAAAGGSGVSQYLYGEQGQFAVDGGARMRVRREYVYGYDEAADRIDVHFADGTTRGGFFHSLRFLPPGGGRPDGSPHAHGDADGAGGGAGSNEAVSVCGGGACAALRQGEDARRQGSVEEGSWAPGSGSETGDASSLDGVGGGGGGGVDGGGDDEEGLPGWRAVGDHLCGRDMYRAAYRFAFAGIQLREFQIRFHVVGPNKDYTATALYTRPSC